MDVPLRVNAFRNRTQATRSITWVIGSGRCFDSRIATLATHESLVTNQSVSAGTGPNGEVSGVRWWELRSPDNNPVIFQEGTYAPGLTDGIHRWMGSIAMNSLGDIALGFSAANDTNPSVFPSVFYTARHDGDPLGEMTLGEGSIKDGTGSQTGSPRWGDYTALDIDPTDDTTFWYINEYISDHRLDRMATPNRRIQRRRRKPIPNANGLTLGHSNGNRYPDLYPSKLPIHVYDRHGYDRAR